MRAVIALFASILIHLALALCLAFFLEPAPDSADMCLVNLTRLEFSFAEEEGENAERTSAENAIDFPSPDSSAATAKLDAPDFPVEPIESFLPESLRYPEHVEVCSVEMEGESLSEDASRQARVIAPPSPLRPIRPDYPRAARRRGEEGEVTLELEVGPSGEVESVRVWSSSGSPALDDAALRAARAARFAPPKPNAPSSSVNVRLSFSFRLKGR